MSRQESIFMPTKRVSVVPYDARYNGVRRNHDLQKSSTWNHTKIKFGKDGAGFRAMPKDIQLGTKKVLGFFAFSDEIVTAMLNKSCLNDITTPEIVACYNFEANMEKEHSQVYNLNIQAIEDDPTERDHLQHAVEHMPLVALKAEFAQRWITDTRKPAYTIVGKAATEGINFSSSFAWIDWLKSQKYNLPGTYLANQEISRDEARHVDTGFLVYDLIDDKLTPDVLDEILSESERIEMLFAADVIPSRPLDRMSVELMSQHIQHAKSIVAHGLGHPELYKGTSSPFDFMKKRSFHTKVNFFEEDSAEYTKLDATEDVDGFTDENAEC